MKYQPWQENLEEVEGDESVRRRHVRVAHDHRQGLHQPEIVHQMEELAIRHHLRHHRMQTNNDPN